MFFDSETGLIEFGNKIRLDTKITKNELLKGGLLWEGWPEKKENKTVSYRLIMKGDKEHGDIYLIVDFIHPNDPTSQLSGWRFAPDKLMIGEQKKTDGKVTRRLREWFKEKTKIKLPVYGSWGHIDAAYDPHNHTGTIVCNYRQGFINDDAWHDYCEWNKN